MEDLHYEHAPAVILAYKQPDKSHPHLRYDLNNCAKSAHALEKNRTCSWKLSSSVALVAEVIQVGMEDPSAVQHSPTLY